MPEGSVGTSFLGVPLQIVLLVVSVLAVAFFSSSEASLISVSKLRIRHLAEQGNRAAQAVDRVVSQHEKFFATILLTENAFVIFASSMGTALVMSVLGSSGASVAIATGIMTVILVTFGEITPKALAAQASERWSMVIARPIEIIMHLETYLIFLFTLVPRGLVRLLKWEERLWTPSITEGELRMLIDLSKVEGAVESAEAEMLEKVFNFGDRLVREIMTPRIELVAVQRGTTLQDFLQMYSEHSHTRFPVYEENVDNIIGTLSVKDVVRALAQGKLKPTDSVTRLLRPAHFVPETKSVAKLFFEMRSHGHPTAVVVDEYGGVAGLVTIKQLLEVVVGPVGEEGEPLEEEYRLLSDNVYRMDGDISIEEANEKMGLGLPEGEYQTVAGFILERLGHIPQEGEMLTYRDLEIKVRKMSGVRIETVDVQRTITAEDV